MAPWVLEHEAVAVVAHAQHGRLELVADLVEELPGKLRKLLNNPMTAPSPYVVDYAVIGAMLIALANADRRHVPRMIALAQRFQYLGGFQPTMAVARMRGMAERVDKAAYEEAVAEYAALRTCQLRPAALELLRSAVPTLFTEVTAHASG